MAHVLRNLKDLLGASLKAMYRSPLNLAHQRGLFAMPSFSRVFSRPQPHHSLVSLSLSVEMGVTFLTLLPGLPSPRDSFATLSAFPSIPPRSQDATVCQRRERTAASLLPCPLPCLYSGSPLAHAWESSRSLRSAQGAEQRGCPLVSVSLTLAGRSRFLGPYSRLTSRTI